MIQAPDMPRPIVNTMRPGSVGESSGGGDRGGGDCQLTCVLVNGVIAGLALPGLAMLPSWRGWLAAGDRRPGRDDLQAVQVRMRVGPPPKLGADPQTTHLSI